MVHNHLSSVLYFFVICMSIRVDDQTAFVNLTKEGFISQAGFFLETGNDFNNDNKGNCRDIS